MGIARDILLPGLWKRDDARGRTLDLVDTESGGMDLLVDRERHALFTRDELEDRQLFVGAFNPRVTEILKG